MNQWECIYLTNDQGSFTGFINYYLEVSGASDQSSVSSWNNILKGRQFAPLPLTFA
jgi:hypothetical protein